MNNLLNISDLLELGFIIPNSNNEYVQDRINQVIELNELPILEGILGTVMTAEFKLEYLAPVPSQRAIGLWLGHVIEEDPNIRYEGLRITVANAIYVQLLIDRVIYVSASGIMASTSENSDTVNPNSLINRYFNEFIRLRNDTCYFLETYGMNWEDYWDIQWFEVIAIRSDYNF